MKSPKMPKISILMNCFNGEKYLKEALESVFNQSYNDWEIVFVDNCSTDNSASIAVSFGSKLKYYKTPHNVQLGEARAFGLEKCHGKYLMYLDVDDRYHVNTIDILLNNISGSSFLVVYGGYQYINAVGTVTGAVTPSPKEGNIFGRLLMQFDIPTACLIMDLEMYRASGVVYDCGTMASAEYSLYLRLAVSHDFKCISDQLVDYRIHPESLTGEMQGNLYLDRITTLENIISQNRSIVAAFPAEFRESFARADYYKAKHYMQSGEISLARAVMKQHRFLAFKYLAVYVIFYMPPMIRTLIFRLKYSR